ncbi:MAG: ECF transporter S component [Candidatus Izemoplasmataceae bacterium]
MRDKRVREMTLTAMFIAIIGIMSFVPWLGFITIGGVAITLIHIPVLIGAIFGGKRVGIFSATAFGVFSMIRAFMTPDAFNVFFQNPLVSILPRFLFGVSIWYIYTYTFKLLKPAIVGDGDIEDDKVKKSVTELTALAVTFALASLTHTVITLTALYIFAFNSAIYLEWFGSTDVLRFIWIIMLSNGLIEVGLAVLIGAPIAYRLKTFYRYEENSVT